MFAKDTRFTPDIDDRTANITAIQIKLNKNLNNVNITTLPMIPVITPFTKLLIQTPPKVFTIIYLSIY